MNAFDLYTVSQQFSLTEETFRIIDAVPNNIDVIQLIYIFLPYIV